MGRSVSFAVPLLGAALAFVLVELFNLAGLVKDLMSQVAALKDVVHHLESKKASQQPDSVPTEVQKKVETPLVEPAPIESTPIPEPVRSLNDEAEERGPKLTVAPVFALFERFFTTGNVFAKVGAIVLFFGVAFLIKLVSDAGLFPIEFRLMSTALGANILIAVGWRLRKKNRPYSLILQGTGFGVFFLTVFGAFRLWHLLPATPALFLLVSATILFVLLSIFQDALSLASLAVTGGFLAPLLTSTGSGSHVQLFTYYALLNTGIFVIAKYRPWRELNLIGFLFTFVVGGVWGSKFYVPEFFASVEPFIIFHFILYTAVVLLFSKLTFELSKELLVDGVLVFGVPLFTFFYQAALLKDTRFGIALSCALLGAVYVGLAFFLFRNKIQEKKSLVQAFVGSGITFSTLTVPYALTHIWTGSVWAIEGAALVWFGLRQEKSKIRYVGYCLHDGIRPPGTSDLLPRRGIGWGHRYRLSDSFPVGLQEYRDRQEGQIGRLFQEYAVPCHGSWLPVPGLLSHRQSYRRFANPEISGRDGGNGLRLC
ncbi:MAG: DUF2339 domain-containing protein [Proteobacteria bacterium]|nr:DUF2339 domain-containing protein [Pseudomonadota bacterium]